jgi:putative transposase
MNRWKMPVWFIAGGLIILQMMLVAIVVHGETPIAIPRLGDGLALALKNAHGRYDAYWNAAHSSSGHAWQGRFYSCPLDEPHLWEALRYIELNPVRAGIVSRAEDWPWSSAATHCGTDRTDNCLTREPWQSRWTASSWRDYLAEGETESKLAAIRQCTHTGRPLGTPEFIGGREKTSKAAFSSAEARVPRKHRHRSEPE